MLDRGGSGGSRMTLAAQPATFAPPGGIDFGTTRCMTYAYAELEEACGQRSISTIN